MPKYKFSSGFSAILVLVLLVTALVGGAYYFYKQGSLSGPTPTSSTTTPDQTVNWKTYTTDSMMDVDESFYKLHPNLEKKILSLKHPPTWKVIKRLQSSSYKNYSSEVGFYLAKAPQGESLYCEDPNEPHCSDEGINPASTLIQLRLGDLPQEANLFDVNYWGQLTVHEKETETSINGVRVIQAFYYNRDSFPIQSVFDLGKAKLLVEASTHEDPTIDYYKDVANEINLILSTFRFLNPPSPTLPLPNQATAIPAPSDPELINFVRSKLKLRNIDTVEIKAIEGNYARGNAAIADDGGFYWAAAKTSGEWSYIMAGNGIPDCKEIEIFPVGTFRGNFDKCYNEQRELIDRKTNTVL